MSAADTAPLDPFVPWAVTGIVLLALSGPWILALARGIGGRVSSALARFSVWANRPAIEAQRRQWVESGNVERRQVKR